MKKKNYMQTKPFLYMSEVKSKIIGNLQIMMWKSKGNQLKTELKLKFQFQ